jgi:3-hydroxyisobutyrate dehydrogenase-like beta-hydroxyacid dehydrogenase
MVSLDVGVIGLGNMGGGVAKNLLDRGYPVYCFDVDEDRRKSIVDEGATECDSPTEVAERADIVVTSLPSTEAMREVYLGEDGILLSDKEDLIAFEISTVDPDAVIDVSNRASKQNVHVIGAPVMGGPQDARRGTLTLILGGEKNIVEMDDVAAFVDDLSSESFFSGGVGSSHTVKLVNNYVDLGSALVMMEGVTLAAARGVDGELLRDLVGGSGDGESINRRRLDRVLERDFDQGFTVEYAMKDLRLYLELADATTYPSYLGSLVYQLHVEAKANGLGEKGPSSVINVFESNIDGRFEAKSNAVKHRD